MRFSTDFKKLQATIQKVLGKDILESSVHQGQLTIYVEKDRILNVLTNLKESNELQMRQLIDICGADYPSRFPRFEVVYHVLSMKMNSRVRVKVRVDEGEAVPSVVPLFAGAVWWERETFDMYGISFEGNPDLRRLLTDYNFDGYPLRKDFPLTGYVEVRYSDEEKRVVYEPVKLQQAYRDFDFLSPWEGMTPTLPGDEKATNDDDSTGEDSTESKAG